MPREYFHTYHSYLSAISPLDEAERGRLFTALLEYSINGEAPELSGNERFVFPMMAETIRRDAKTYDEKCAKLRDNGRKAKAGYCMQKHANGGNCAQDKDEDKDKEKDKDNYKDKNKDEDYDKYEDYDKEEDGDIAPARPSADDFVDLFRSVCVSLPCPQGLTADRERYISVITRDNGPDACREIFRRVEDSDFLTGKGGKSWKASLDWLIRPDNWRKVAEGNYDNNAPAEEPARNKPGGGTQHSAEQRCAPTVGQRFAPTYDIAEIERLLDEEWNSGF